MYALSLLIELLRSAKPTLTEQAKEDAKEKLDVIFGTVLNPDVSQIPERLC